MGGAPVHLGGSHDVVFLKCQTLPLEVREDHLFWIDIYDEENRSATGHDKSLDEDVQTCACMVQLHDIESCRSMLEERTQSKCESKILDHEVLV